MWPVLVPVYVLSSCHGIIAVLSICIGIASSMSADVWMAHRVSPIWSGGFFLLTSVSGVICAQKKTVYLIMCFGAFSVVSMVVGVVSIQLLKLGLVNHMSDGDTLKKESNDELVIMAIATAGAEILVCIISGLVSIRVAHKARKELHKKNEGTFSVSVHGEKDITIHPTKFQTDSYDRLSDRPSEAHTDSTQRTNTVSGGSLEVTYSAQEPLDRISCGHGATAV